MCTSVTTAVGVSRGPLSAAGRMVGENDMHTPPFEFTTSLAFGVFSLPAICAGARQLVSVSLCGSVGWVVCQSGHARVTDPHWGGIAPGRTSRKQWATEERRATTPPSTNAMRAECNRRRRATFTRSRVIV